MFPISNGCFGWHNVFYCRNPSFYIFAVFSFNEIIYNSLVKINFGMLENGDVYSFGSNG